MHWRTFLESLLKRGMHGVQLIVSDAHSGLKAARKSVLPGTPWQRCQFHLQQNAQSYVPRKNMKEAVAEKIRCIFNAEDKAQALVLLQSAVESYAEVAPDLSKWMAESIPEGLAVFDFPAGHRKKIRTSNLLERLNKEIKRRTRVVTLFPSESSCERLISAILMEKSEEWETGRAYIKIKK